MSQCFAKSHSSLLFLASATLNYVVQIQFLFHLGISRDPFLFLQFNNKTLQNVGQKSIQRVAELNIDKIYNHTTVFSIFHYKESIGLLRNPRKRECLNLFSILALSTHHIHMHSTSPFTYLLPLHWPHWTHLPEYSS